MFGNKQSTKLYEQKVKIVDYALCILQNMHGWYGIRQFNKRILESQVVVILGYAWNICEG